MSKANADKLILVTGATGKQGSAVLNHLRQRKFPVRALSRNPETPAARELANTGVEVVAGDFNDSDSLRRATDGVYGVFAMSTLEQGIDAEIAQGKALAEAAQRSDVTHYVYTSVAAADRKTGIPHFDSKYEVEEHVRNLGFPYFTILRPVFFMENWLGMKDSIQAGNIYWPLSPEKKLQQVATTDIGAFGALAFEHHDHWRGRAVELSGDERSMTDIAAAFGHRLAREVTYHQIPWDQFEKNAGHEMTVMFRWFEDHGYTVDIHALRQEYAELTGFEKWLNGQHWETK